MLRVFYDDECAFCVRCRAAFAGYEAIAPIRFVPLRSPEAHAFRIPGGGVELVVVDDSGAYWIGPSAFLACLWAFDETRWIASMLALPLLRPIGAWFFRVVSRNRSALSPFLGVRCSPYR